MGACSFQPAHDQLDRLVAVALKTLYFEAVLGDEDRMSGDSPMPLASYIAHECHRYLTSHAVSGEPTCRAP